MIHEYVCGALSTPAPQSYDERQNISTTGGCGVPHAVAALVLFVTTVVAPAFAAASAAPRNASGASLASPGGVLEVDVAVDNDGHAYYTVSRKGHPVIAPSRLGFLLADAAKLDRNFTLASVERARYDETWEQPWGERRYVRDRYNEMRVRLTQSNALARSLDVVFRVYDDGLGFRYEFPQQGSLDTVKISEELTEFAVADPATAWWIPAGEWNRYEYLYNKTPLGEVSQAHTPITVRTDGGLHIAFHEAALIDYSSMWLRRVTGQRLKAALSPSASGPKVVRRAPFATPWRTMQIADSAAGLLMSDLILNLNEPNKLGDVSWVRPYKYVGIWWGMHLGTQSWEAGPRHGATTANTRRLIDFAAKHGFRGVLVEGWNRGWEGDWFANGDSFRFTEPYPDFDLEQVAAYAKAKGVRLIGHHETAANVANYEAQLGAALDLYARLGIDSVKTGYVADAGGVKVKGADGRFDFEWHDGQVMSRHHLKVVTEAAQRRISINPHEPIKDTGLRRTYPNWVAREGARGMEYNAWGAPPNPPEHEANLVFTRMLAGPMDFTPGVLSLTGKDGQPIQSTIAKQLALYVVIYSPIQMAADLPESYEKHRDAFQFIKDVPTDWADTQVLHGEVGDFVTFVRKDRNSDDWYLGSVSDEAARTLTATLDFLDPGRRYTAQIYRDGDDADWRSKPHAISIETRPVKRGDTLTLRLAPGGGQAIRFVAGPKS
jgi:alpha-glucosidase